MGASNGAHILGTLVPLEEPSTASKAVARATQLNVETAPKRLEVLREGLPKAAKFGLLLNAHNPMSGTVSSELKAAAQTLGVGLQIFQASNDGEIADVFATLPQTKVEGLVVGTGAFYNSKSALIAASALKLKLPTVFQYDTFR